MTRLRWFTLRGEVNLQEFATELLRREYTAEVGRGFVVSSTTSTSVEGTFTVRREIEDIAKDPLGSEVRFQRVLFESVRFIVTGNHPQLEVTCPAPPLAAFLHAIAEATTFTVSVVPCRVRVAQWLTNIESELPISAVRLACSGLVLDAQTRADFVVSGTDDVRHHLTRLAPQDKVEIARARLLIQHPDGIADCELSRNGFVVLRSQATPSILNLLRRTIPRE